MNSENSKKFEPHVLILKLDQITDNLDLRKGKKDIALSNLLHMEKHKKLINNNKFTISAPAWNHKFELPDGLYSISNIQDYFEYTSKSMEKILIKRQ